MHINWRTQSQVEATVIRPISKIAFVNIIFEIGTLINSTLLVVILLGLVFTLMTSLKEKSKSVQFLQTNWK